MSKSQYLLFDSVYELEPHVFDALKAIIPFPLYHFGPSVPYFQLDKRSAATITCNNLDNATHYIQLLDSQPKGSVLYVSLGSFISVSSAQLEEITAGLKTSGARFLWVLRSDVSRFEDLDGSGIGLVVLWCDQLRVLYHTSIGGFWSHCGWNSSLEAIFGGIPVLAFPIFWDQIPNSKAIAEDWKIGWCVRKYVWNGGESLVKRDESSTIVKRFMHSESDQGKMMTKREKELQEVSKCTTITFDFKW